MKVYMCKSVDTDEYLRFNGVAVFDDKDDIKSAYYLEYFLDFDLQDDYKIEEYIIIKNKEYCQLLHVKETVDNLKIILQNI
jgi:hypothetical protein